MGVQDGHITGRERYAETCTPALAKSFTAYLQTAVHFVHDAIL